MVGLRAASNMPAPPPSLSKTNAKWSRGACVCSRFECKVYYVYIFTRMVGMRALSNMAAPPPSSSKSNAKWSRGACACSRFGGKVHSVWFFDRDGWPVRSEQYDGTPAVPVKNQFKVVAGCPRVLQI